jgi:dihydrofolate reductase
MEGDKDRSGHWGNPNNEGATGEEYCGMGGATFVSSLMNMGLIDEVRLMGQSHHFGWRKSSI